MIIQNVKLPPTDWNKPDHSLRITDPNATTKDYAALLSKAPGISYLHIINPYIRELPESALNNFSNLTSINLECSRLRKLPAKWFERPLTQVMIKCPNIAEIPNSIWQNPALYTLQILNLNLREIPEFEPRFERLYSFKLKAPFLEKLPESLSQIDAQIIEVLAPQIEGIGDVLNHQTKLVSLTLEAPEAGFNGDLRGNERLQLLKLINIQTTRDGILKRLPDKLQELILFGKPGCWQDAFHLDKLPYLKKLQISYYQGGHFPESIGQSTTLEGLYLSNCHFSHLPEALLNCPNLTSLSFYSGSIKAFPGFIARHPRLRQANIYNVLFKTIPKDWSKATSLEYFSLREAGLNLEDLSFIESMPNIKNIDIRGNTFSNKEVLLIKKGVHMHYTRPSDVRFKKLQNYQKICAAIARTDLDEKDKQWFVNYFAQKTDIKAVDDLDWQALLQATNINYGMFRKKVLLWIHNKIDAQIPKPLFPPSAVLYISGKTKLTKTEIKKMCRELGVEVVPRLESSVTHVLLGSPCKDYEELEEESYVYLTENHLQDHYSKEKPQFLEQAEQSAEENPLVNNVSSLLQSTDMANVLLGLEMLKSGGVPKGLIEDLIVIQKTTADSKVRTNVKKLLELHAPAEWLPVIRDTLSFKNITSRVPENALRKQLKKLADRSSSEMAGRLSLLLFRRYQRGLRFALLAKVPEAIRKEAIQLLFDGTHFDYAKGIGYRNWKNSTPESVILYGSYGSKVMLPVKALDLGKIESLNLHNCKYETIRREITEFKDLLKLDLSHNYIKKIPAYFLQLENLRELDLSYNVFPEFPMKLKKFKKLRRLDLRHNRAQMGFEPLVVPDEFREALPDCEVLV